MFSGKDKETKYMELKPRWKFAFLRSNSHKELVQQRFMSLLTSQASQISCLSVTSHVGCGGAPVKDAQKHRCISFATFSCLPATVKMERKRDLAGTGPRASE